MLRQSRGIIVRRRPTLPLPEALLHFRRLGSVPKSEFSRSGLDPGLVRTAPGAQDGWKTRFAYHVRECGLPAGDRASVVFALHANPPNEVHLRKVDANNNGRIARINVYGK
ncbi:hypothetical protein TcasGA2_TC032490 [Tribolium castaneum]|uniref:Uncharacterized protein n=1 Tax=Tribolium castaneum TaxID=7070 RepID=A0A139WKX8_TRICA|nr:hypothetical protein TcasGA2_TC032490 [Tribolium castaneum]